MKQIKIDKVPYNKFINGIEQLRLECGIPDDAFYAYLRYFTKRFEDHHGLSGDEVKFDKKTESGLVT